MQRLPNVNPTDPKYTNGIGTFDVGAASEGCKILFYNESPLNIQLDFLNGSTDTLHAWEANYWVLDADTKQIEWELDPDSLNVSTPPISVVFMTLYGPQERLSGTYPMALIRQASVGNLGGIATTSTNQLINDGNTLQEVIEATLSGHITSDVIINNDGSFTLTGPGLIAAAGVLTHIFGSLTVDQAVSLASTLSVTGVTTHTGNIVANGGMNVGTIRDDASGAVQATLATAGITIQKLLILLAALQVAGTTSLDGGSILTDGAGNMKLQTLESPGGQTVLDGHTNGDIFINIPNSGGSKIGHLQQGGVDQVLWDGTGLTIASGDHIFWWGGIDSISQTHSFTGSGSGTYNHGCHSAPYIVIPVVDTAGSATQGYDTVTATQVHITLGAALAFKALCMVG